MKFKILKPSGSGGFGTVFEVEGENGVKYAMKELKNLNIANKQRFDREIKILAQLNHPNIVKIFQWNLGGDPPNFSPWYVMEYLRGGSLRQHMDEKFSQDYVFPRKWILNTIILPACNALAQAHSSDIYHRDLKPENIMYTTNARAEIKITDWGLGKDANRESIALTAAIGEIGGAPGYCAPEQWFALDNVDGRADIFSLGIIFYEMLTGRRPPTFNNRMKRADIDLPSKRHPTISAKMDQCILKMIDLDPENRYHSIWDLIADLESLPDNYS